MPSSTVTFATHSLGKPSALIHRQYDDENTTGLLYMTVLKYFVMDFEYLKAL